MDSRRGGTNAAYVRVEFRDHVVHFSTTTFIIYEYCSRAWKRCKVSDEGKLRNRNAIYFHLFTMTSLVTIVSCCGWVLPSQNMLYLFGRCMQSSGLQMPSWSTQFLFASLTQTYTSAPERAVPIWNVMVSPKSNT